ERQAPAQYRPAGADEEPAEHRADRDRNAHGRSQVSEGLAAIVATEVMLDHPDDLRAQQARADSLDEARRVEPGRIRGKAGRDGGQGEDTHAHQEDAPTSDDVARAPGRDQDDPERERI